MDVKELILKNLTKGGVIKVTDIIRATGFSRAYINRFLGELRGEGKIVLVGKANRARYVLPEKEAVARAKNELLDVHRILENRNLSEDLILDEIKKNAGIFEGLSKNVSEVLDYAFTEMLNNAVEHSKSKKIEIKMERGDADIRFKVVDFGIGVFKHIMNKKGLKDELEAIQDLLKGKQTTAPEKHSGEGIFFTSKAADILELQSSKKKLVFHNILDDIFIKDIKFIRGTKVTFIIGLKSKRKLSRIFREYSGNSLKFSKTKVIVRLYKMGNEYISRSQARRILSGLDAFEKVILDFTDVETVGQAFVDEVFRVWGTRHPQIEIIPQNANKNVSFMLNRVSLKT